MKVIYLLSFVLLLSGTAKAQAKKTLSPQQSAVKMAAKKMDVALVQKDYTSFVSTTYPEVVKRSEGGLAKMATDMSKQVATMEASGTKITDAWPGEPSAIIDTAGELQCTIPQFMKLQIGGGMLTTETTLLCFSPDKGGKWYFIDATDKTLSDWRQVFPNISSKLVLPKPAEPKFEPDEELKKTINKHK